MAFDCLETGERKCKLKSWPIIFPHDILHYLFNNGMMISEQSIQQYWAHNCRHGAPWAQDPATHQMVPIGIFGDGATIKKEFGGESLIGITMNVILWRPRSTRLSRFLLFAFPVAKEWGHFSLQTVWRHITWSLNACYDGCFPSVDAFARDLDPRLAKFAEQSLTRNSLRFCTTECRGDWQWHKKVWRFNRASWNGIKMCHLCDARAKGHTCDLYWNFNGAAWRDTPFTAEEFMDERIPPHGICRLASNWATVFSLKARCLNSRTSTHRSFSGI